MSDDICHIKVEWTVTAKLPDGPDISGTGGSIDVDTQMTDKVIVPAGKHEDGDNGTSFPFVKSRHYTIVLMRAKKEDNNGNDIHQYLKYRFGGEGEPKKFGRSPLLLIGSVGKLIHDFSDITFWYEPAEPECDVSSATSAKPVTPAPPLPKKATISILLGKAKSAPHVPKKP